MTTILHLIGNTCAGKTTLIDRMVALAPDEVGAIQIGQMLRAKYGEDYFKGQAAPDHTQDEANCMYLQGVTDLLQSKKLILVDGQPRTPPQVKMCLDVSDAVTQTRFLLMHASEEAREKRAKAGRSPGPNLDLALARLQGDYKGSYDVLAELLKTKNGCRPDVKLLDTTHMGTCTSWCINYLKSLRIDSNVSIERTTFGSGGFIRVSGDNAGLIDVVAKEELVSIDRMRSPSMQVRQGGYEVEIHYYGLD